MLEEGEGEGEGEGEEKGEGGEGKREEGELCTVIGVTCCSGGVHCVQLYYMYHIAESPAVLLHSGNEAPRNFLLNCVLLMMGQ